MKVRSCNELQVPFTYSRKEKLSSCVNDMRAARVTVYEKMSSEQTWMNLRVKSGEMVNWLIGELVKWLIG